MSEYEPLKTAWQILAETFLFVAIAATVGMVGFHIVARYLRPKADESAFYCCGCTGWPCGWGCCHLSCVIHDPAAIDMECPNAW